MATHDPTDQEQAHELAAGLVDSVMFSMLENELQLDNVSESLVEEPDLDPEAIEAGWQEGRKQLKQLVRQLFPDDLLSQIQALLDKLSGASFGSYSDNKRIVEQLNLLSRAYRFHFVIRGDDRPVRLRCINPPRARQGYFQARTADSRQRAIYTGATLPALVIDTTRHLPRPRPSKAPRKPR